MQDIKFTKFNNQIWEDRNIKGYEKLVLIYLISYNNETFGYSFPTRKQIQADVGISENTLSKTLDSLVEKGYITKKEHISKTGRNNIYYIHKYLVVSKKVVDEKSADIEEAPEDKKPDVRDTDNRQEASTNELLVKERAKLVRALKPSEMEAINELDTELLIKAIDRANKCRQEGYHIGYILKTYDSIKNNPSEPHREPQDNKSTNNSNGNTKGNRGANKKPMTRYHNSFNEHYKNYDYDDLEKRLLEMQERKRKGLAQ